MSRSEPTQVRWLDFSGAPPMLIPQSLATSWRGGTEPTTDRYRDLDAKTPVTDYDRACAVAWPGKNILEFQGSPILAFYTEFHLHCWDTDRQILASGGWFPSDAEIQRANWSDPIHWRAEHTDCLLMNSAVDATRGLQNDDFMRVRLSLGTYTIEFADIAAEYVGCFHRFVREDQADA